MLRDWAEEVRAEYARSLRGKTGWGVTFVVCFLGLLIDPYKFVVGSPAVAQVLFWFVGVCVGVALAQLLRAMILAWNVEVSLTAQDLLVSAAIAIFYYPLAILIALATIPGFGEETGSFVAPAFATFGLVLTMSNIRRAIEEQLREKPTRDRLLDRLDCSRTARVMRLSSSDHHVVVVLTDGSEHRLRMRLRDAVNEIDVEPGICVHRSHWVALGSIDHARNGGAKATVHLKSGAVVPVGPKYRSELVAHGFLES